MRGIFEKLKRPRNCCLEPLPPMVWRKLKEAEVAVALAQKLYDEKGLSAAKIARLFDRSPSAISRLAAPRPSLAPARERARTHAHKRSP